MGEAEAEEEVVAVEEALGETVAEGLQVALVRLRDSEGEAVAGECVSVAEGLGLCVGVALSERL